MILGVNIFTFYLFFPPCQFCYHECFIWQKKMPEEFVFFFLMAQQSSLYQLPQAYHNQLPQTQRLKSREIYSLTVCRTEVQNQGVADYLFIYLFFAGFEGESVPGFSLCLDVRGLQMRYPNICLSLNSLLFCIFGQNSSF